MANNWAIAIGINQYQFFQPLACAKADAEALQAFLVNDGGFREQQCMLMTDNSPPIGDRPTSPTKENILSLLEDLAAACWRPQDRVWFFFSGYGINHNGKDYLMSIDANPELVEETGIEVATIMQSLQVAGVKVLILLDINRAFGIQADAYVGQEIIELAQELQIPLILSCQPEQFSYESSELGHGFFTAALLEALRSGNGKTLGELEAYLSSRTPSLCQHYWRPTQNPVTVITSSKQVILGNSELENDMDAAAIVVTEEMFASVLAAPPLEPNPSNSHSQFSSVNNISGTSFGKQGYVNSGIKEPVSHQVKQQVKQQANQELLPPLNQAKPKGEALPSASGLKEPNNSQINDLNQPVSAPGIPYWQQVLLWGGSTALLLSLMVIALFRSQSVPRVEQPYSVPPNSNSDETAFVNTIPDTESNIPAARPTPLVTPEPQPQVTATAPAPVPTPVVTPSVVPSAAPQSRKLALSELDKLSLSPTVASDLISAIATARKVKLTEPDYPQAQANIQVWNNMIFDLAVERAKKRQYSNAIAAATFINPSQPLYPKAQTAIAQWRKQAKQHLSNKTLVEAAAGLIKPGQASTYNRAIEVAKKVPPSEPGYDIAQKSIDKWSKKILELAKNRAEVGDFKAAIGTAVLVPEGTPARNAAHKAIQRWKK
jgi:uncharacterized caspase-like protein